MTETSQPSDQSQSDSDQYQFVQSSHVQIPPPIHARPTVQRSEYTGLLFPTGRVWHHMREEIVRVNGDKNEIRVISPDAAVYLTAVLESLTSTLLQSSGNAAKRMLKSRIEPTDILAVSRMDDAFGTLLTSKESAGCGARASVPASPLDVLMTHSSSQQSNTGKTPVRPAPNLTFWPEADRESETECTDQDHDATSRHNGNKESRSRSGSVDDDILELLHHVDVDDHMIRRSHTSHATQRHDEQSLSYTLNNDDQFIPGLFYVENYVSQAQHDRMVQIVNNNEWQQKVETRVVQHYGYDIIDEDEPQSAIRKLNQAPFHEIPTEMQRLVHHVLHDDLFGIPSDHMDEIQQMTVDNFPSFGGLHSRLENIHLFDEYIIGVSLLSDAVMQFTHIESKQTKHLLLRPKSVLILSGEARYQWKYGITQNKTHTYNGRNIHRQQRISLTFRKCLTHPIPPISTNTNHRFLSKIDSLLHEMDQFMEHD